MGPVVSKAEVEEVNSDVPNQESPSFQRVNNSTGGKREQVPDGISSSKSEMKSNRTPRKGSQANRLMSGGTSSTSTPKIRATCKDKLEGKSKRSGPGVLVNVKCENPNPGEPEALTRSSANDDRGMITLASAEKWCESTSTSDHEMEEGELSCSEEGANASRTPVCSPSTSWSESNNASDKRWPTHDKADGKVRKRMKLDVNNLGRKDQIETCKQKRDGCNNENGNCIDKNLLYNYYSSESSSVSDGCRNEEQFASYQQSPQASSDLDQSRHGDMELDSSSESMLLPLFRNMIDSERKKKSELEAENKRLKSLLETISMEKEETFQLLRQSNKTLAEITDTSIALEKKVEELNAQLAEKEVLVSNLQNDTFAIRGMVLRMAKTFDDLRSKECPTQTGSLSGGGERRDAKTERLNVPKSNWTDRHSRPLTSRRDAPRDSKYASSSSAGRNPSPARSSSGMCHSLKMKESSKLSPATGNQSLLNLAFNADEIFIMSKLKDLTRWAYTIRDIKKIDGRWICPQCGEGKYTLLATAAHARDKHVWKIGAGLRPR